jgi:hypothetical protein
MTALARELQSRGHRVSIVGQRIDIFTSGQAGAAELWQAPVSPRLLTNAAQQSALPAASHGDILAKVGFDDPAIVRAIIGAWDRLLAAVSPDLIIAEYAPFLLLAARDRLPAVAVGTGFELPPVHLAHFPLLAGGESIFTSSSGATAIAGATSGDSIFVSSGGAAGLGTLQAANDIRVDAASIALASGTASRPPGTCTRTRSPISSNRSMRRACATRLTCSSVATTVTTTARPSSAVSLASPPRTATPCAPAPRPSS